MEWGVFIDEKVQEYSFCPPKKYNSTKQAFRCIRILHRIVCISGCSEYSELSNILPRDLKVKYFSKGTEKLRILLTFLDKELETMGDHGCPEIRDLVET